MAAQLGLAAWMIGVLAESSCFPVLPRPTAAQTLGIATVNEDGRSAIAATSSSGDQHQVEAP